MAQCPPSAKVSVTTASHWTGLDDTSRRLGPERHESMANCRRCQPKQGAFEKVSKQGRGPPGPPKRPPPDKMTGRDRPPPPLRKHPASPQGALPAVADQPSS